MKGIDKLTSWAKTISGPHHEAHEGKFFKCYLTTANIVLKLAIIYRYHGNLPADQHK